MSGVYSGSFLLRMMSLYLSEDVFRRGVTRYLMRHKFSNAEQDDLWKCLTEVAHEDQALPENMTVKMVMDTWTVQTGYPIITVTRDYQNGTAHLTQASSPPPHAEQILQEHTCTSNLLPNTYYIINS